MKRTHKHPTKPGWYWYAPVGGVLEPVRMCYDHAGGQLYVSKTLRSDLIGCTLDELMGVWSSTPIEEPTA